MITDDYINDRIEEAIDHLADDNPKMGAEAMVGIAELFAKAGMPYQTFLDMRQYIIKEAEERTDAFFIKEKLIYAERNLREVRNGTRIN